MEELGLLVPSDLEGQLVPLDLRVKTVSLVPLGLLVLRVLPGLRGMLVNVDPLDLSALRVLLDPLVEELVELPFLDLRVTLARRGLLGLRANRGAQALLDHLAPRVLLDLLALQENVVRPDRMQSPLSLISTLPNLRLLRLMARRRTSRMHSDRPTRSRMAPGTTRQ